ncbi:MAG TPA: BBE domain-containing protein, partial [Pyrinomonadaceae bacterium]
GMSGYIRSGFMAPGAFTPSCIDVLTSNMTSAPSPNSLLVWTHMGGKVTEVDKKETAFWHRDARFLWEVKAIWSATDQTVQNVDWAYKLGEEMAPHSIGAYCNYIDPLLHNWQKEFYGDNYKRLVQIKKAVDPDEHFRFQQAIGSPFNPSPEYPPNQAPLYRTFLV